MRKKVTCPPRDPLLLGLRLVTPEIAGNCFILCSFYWGCTYSVQIESVLDTHFPDITCSLLNEPHFSPI